MRSRELARGRWRPSQLLTRTGRQNAARTVAAALPARLRRLVEAARAAAIVGMCDVVDAFDALTGRSDPLRPPRRMIFVGSNSVVRSDYHAIGRELVELAGRLAGLRERDAVLEIGSGTGRIAASLTRVLDARGRFDGFEIVRQGVEWCQRNITPRHPNFRFQHADIFNAFYNPDGSHTASSYRFPYDDATFDLVIATSVFTHLYRADAAHYLAETARVLRPGGRSFITHFLLTARSSSFLEQGRAGLPFQFPVPDGLSVDRERPESAIAVPEELVRQDYTSAGLEISEPIRFGRWGGGDLHFQDIVVARKPGPRSSG